MTTAIDRAISLLSREGDRLMFGAEYSRGKDMVEAASAARKELSALQAELPRLRELKASFDRGYDAHVTSTEGR